MRVGPLAQDVHQSPWQSILSLVVTRMLIAQPIVHEAGEVKASAPMEEMYSSGTSLGELFFLAFVAILSTPRRGVDAG